MYFYLGNESLEAVSTFTVLPPAAEYVIKLNLTIQHCQKMMILTTALRGNTTVVLDTTCNSLTRSTVQWRPSIQEKPPLCHTRLQVAYQ